MQNGYADCGVSLSANLCVPLVAVRLTIDALATNPRMITAGGCASVTDPAGRVLTFHHLRRCRACLWCGRCRRVVVPVAHAPGYVRWWLCAKCAPLAIAAIADNRPLFNIPSRAAATLRLMLMTKPQQDAHIARVAAFWGGGKG